MTRLEEMQPLESSAAIGIGHDSLDFAEDLEGQHEERGSRTRQDVLTLYPQNASTSDDPPKFDMGKEIFPSSIVWCSLCGITWFLPMVGHMGITDESGEIYEFLGLGATKSGGLAFGPVLRYIPLNRRPSSRESEDKRKMRWNDAVALGNRQCRGRGHKCLFDNCHTYVADVLNNMEYANFGKWNSVILAMWVFFCGKYTSLPAVVLHWLPFFIIATGIVIWHH
ncbi:unnamed protein product [Amoebophrya sp. A25]|nr:unnamed protein product [Amoebophrya sp. A25]|eukprot:GSA25T00022286001.1